MPALILALTLAIFGFSLQAHGSPKQIYSNIKFHPLYLEEDSSSDLAFVSMHDHDGYLWIGTDNGLKRYDGYRMQSFVNNANDPDTIGSVYITAILSQRTGELWVAGRTLDLYHPETETFSRFNVSKNGEAIWALYEDHYGILWVGGEGVGLRAFDLKTKQVVHQFFPSSNENFVTAITPHNDSSIWVASNAGIFLFNVKTHQITQYPMPAEFSLGIDSIRSLTEDNQGNLWVATMEGLVVLDIETQKIKRHRAAPQKHGALKSNEIWSVFLDSHERMWVGTDKRGVYIHQPETDSFFHFPASDAGKYAFPPGAVNNIQEDDEGSLWFSVSSYGMRRVSEHLEKFASYKHLAGDNKSLSFDNLLDLHEDSSGYIWLATDGGGLDKFDPSTGIFSHYRHDPNDPSSISSNSVIALAEDAQGYIWAGTWAGGLNRLDPRNGKFLRIQHNPDATNDQTLDSNNIFQIEIDSYGLLYLSSWRRGIQTYDPVTGRFETYHPIKNEMNTGMINYSVNDILPMDNGKVWIGGQAGLESLDIQTQQFTTVDIDGFGGIFDLHLDTEGILWIASAQNFIRYNPQTNKAKFYSIQDGVAASYVASIEADKHGYLWLGTRNGLNRFDPKTESFETFNETDGLVGKQFNRLSHLSTRSGRLYFGSTSGLSSFDPSVLPKNTHSPAIHLTGIELFQNPVKIGEEPWLSSHINLQKKLELAYDQRDITFEFTALNFISPLKNRYRYKLEGLDREWIEAGSNRRRARYTNLDPGKYTFRVLGSNNDGVWSTSEKAVEIVIHPAWWQSLRARILLSIILLALVYLFIYWRLEVNKYAQKALEVLVEDKTTEVNELNERLENRVKERTNQLLVEIEERRNAEEKLFYMAFHDSLTGLKNRPWVQNHIEKLIEIRSESNTSFAF
ncbi:ligand-binding sensor domain-containing protein [Teredinibacter haidensis]|uniref:ligand-binding sensor domain-containing protein n=1 Tax=Teredinibacter haidensis TaxID=2731755 RepID=UPI000948BC40|nr:two-component regulator propeller domain-containing protein [Teredinibacter haidensis]